MNSFHILKLLLSTLVVFHGIVAVLENPANAEPPAGDLIVNSHPQPEYGPAIPFRKIPGTSGTLALEIAGSRL